MSLRTLALLPLLSVFVYSHSAFAGESLWTHKFASESGVPQSIDQDANPGDTTLVMFWANWCLPCKAELAELAKRKSEIPKNLRLVAVNVDDPSGLPMAQSFLSSIRWPFRVLRDGSGQFFFEYNRSGQLPYSVLLDDRGTEVKSFQKLTEPDVAEAISRAKTTAVAADGGLTGSNPGAASGSGSGEAAPSKLGMSYGVHGEGVDFNGDNGVHNRLATTTAFARADSKAWTAQLQYDFLYEELSGPGTTTKGDEIGYSYLEYHAKIGPGRGQLRAGDSYVTLLGGELLSLQKLPSLVDPAHLRGGSAQWDQGSFSVTAFGGDIHPTLFITPINPTTALALPLANEKVEGGSIFWHDDGDDRKSSVSLNFANYHRGINASLGNSTKVDDARYGAEVYHRSGKSGLQVRGAEFSTNTGTAGTSADKPYIIDPYFWYTFPGLDHQIYSFHYLEYQSLPARTLTPVLVETPAQPLQVEKMRSFRLSPKFFNETETVWFEPIWIFEESIFATPYERQNSYGFNLSLPQRDLKAIAFYQDGELSPTSKYRETSLLATAPLYGALTGQVLLRHHDAQPLSGDSQGLNLGVDLSKLWKIPVKGTFLLTGSWTKQNGYYWGFSGIARDDLFSGRLEWTEGVNTIRLAVGAEPGGIVCTNGVCVQKPPLNGADLEVAFSF